MHLQGHFTGKGLSLAAKLSVGSPLVITRVAAGSGVTQNPVNATSLSQIRQTLTVNTASCSGSTATIPVTLAAALAQESYALTELGVYAQDPDEGEILYKLYQMDTPVPIIAGSRTVLRFYLEETLSEDGSVNVTCSPDGLITEMDFLPVQKKVMVRSLPYRSVSLSAGELMEYLNSLPRLLTEDLTITVSGTCANKISFSRFYGPGTLTIQSDTLGNAVFNEMAISDCRCHLYIKNLEFHIQETITTNPEGALVLNGCPDVKLESCSFSDPYHTSSRWQAVGIYTKRNTLCLVDGCTIKNVDVAVVAYHNSIMSINGGTFSGNANGADVNSCAIIMLNRDVPSTTLGGGSNVKKGGLIVKSDGTLL